MRDRINAEVVITVDQKEKMFDKLVNGRLFYLFNDTGRYTDKVFIKLNKNMAQDIQDENYKIKMSPNRLIVEASIYIKEK